MVNSEVECSFGAELHSRDALAVAHWIQWHTDTGMVEHWHTGKVSPLQEKNPKKGLHFRSWITKQSFTRSCFKIVLENFTSHPGMKILGKVSLIKQSTCNTWSPALISCVSAWPGRLSTGPEPQRGKLATRPWPVHRYRRSGYVRPPADGLICCPLFITPLLATNSIWLCSAWGFFPCLICWPFVYFYYYICLLTSTCVQQSECGLVGCRLNLGQNWGKEIVEKFLIQLIRLPPLCRGGRESLPFVKREEWEQFRRLSHAALWLHKQEPRQCRNYC